MPDTNPDDLLLLIRCPSCGQRFKVGEDLRGRTVECGSCEHRFRINDEVVVRGKKFYPGERRDASLNRFQRVPLAMGSPNPAVQTVRYAEPPSPVNFEPTPPLRILAAAFGVAIMVFMALLVILGTNRGGALDGMTTENRLLMLGFISVLASGLIIYGNPKTRLKAGFFAVILSAALISLPFFFNQNSTPLDQADMPAEGTPPRPRPEEPVVDPYGALRLEIGTGPLEDEIEKLKASGSTKTAIGLWLRDLRETNRIVVRDFILRTLDADPDTHYYPRGDGNFLMVVTGINHSLSEVASVVSAFGAEVKTHPGIDVVEIKVDNSLFVEGPIEKLTNQKDPAFYDLNKRELESIDLQRVSKAVRRLADAEPSVYRSDITRRLIALMAEDWVDFKGDVARALSSWSETPGPAGEAALVELKDVVVKGGSVPPDLVALIVKEKNLEVIPLLDELWRRNPTQWESLYAEMGNPAEDSVIRFFPRTDGSQRQSAVRLLGKVGAADSLAVLEAAEGSVDPELKVLIEQRGLSHPLTHGRVKISPPARIPLPSTFLPAKLRAPLVSRQAGMIRGENSGRAGRGALRIAPPGSFPVHFILGHLPFLGCIGRMPHKHHGWDDSKLLARAILHDRAARRKWIGRMIMLPLLMIAAGLWLIDDWLGQSALRFLCWWGVCAIATLVVMLFTVYDALAAIREERDRFR